MLFPIEREKIADAIRSLRFVHGTGDLNFTIERKSGESITIKYNQMIGSIKVEKRMDQDQWPIDSVRYADLEAFEKG